MVNIHVVAQLPNGKIYDPQFPEYAPDHNYATRKIKAKDLKPTYKLLEGEEERKWFLKIHSGSMEELKANKERTGLTTDEIAAVFYTKPRYLQCYWNAWAYKRFHPEAKIKICWFGYGSEKKNKVIWLFSGREVVGDHKVEKLME